jgi:hypothetical protein
MKKELLGPLAWAVSIVLVALSARFAREQG